MNIDLEDVLTNSHAVSRVMNGDCCYSDELVCNCGWSGDPNRYGLHLLATLGLDQAVLNDWQYVRYTNEVNDVQKQEYLNIYRGPKNQRKITKEERKSGVLNVIG
jgi:hypothetical protein